MTPISATSWVWIALPFSQMKSTKRPQNYGGEYITDGGRRTEDGGRETEAAGPPSSFFRPPSPLLDSQP